MQADDCTVLMLVPMFEEEEEEQAHADKRSMHMLQVDGNEAEGDKAPDKDDEADKREDKSDKIGPNLYPVEGHDVDAMAINRQFWQ